MLRKFAHLISESLSWKFVVSLVFVYFSCSQLFNQRAETLRKYAEEFQKISIGTEEYTERFGITPIEKEKLGKTFDPELYYSAKEMPARIYSFGPEGRKLYAISEVTLDLLFPFVYPLLLAFIIAALWGDFYLRSAVIQALSLLPFLAAGFDLLENISIAILLMQNSAKVNLMMSIASWATTAKSSLLLLSTSVVLVGLAVSLFRLVRSFVRNPHQSA